MPLSDTERSLYRLHARSNAFRKRLDLANKVIAESLEGAHRPLVACSWGKDSTVALHLVLQHRPDVEVLYCDRSVEGGGELPETYALIEMWQQRFGVRVHRATPKISIIDALREAQGWGDGDLKKLGAKVRREITIGPAEALRQQLGGDVLYLGLRAEENPSSRGLYMQFRGLSYRRKSGFLQVCPIGFWTARDVWAYICAHDLPYHPIYDKTTFEPREEIRFANWAGSFVDWKNGHWAKMRHYYPDLWRLIVEEVPGIGQFG